MAYRTSIEAGLNDIAYVVPVAAKAERLGSEKVIAIFEMQGIPVADGLAAYNSNTAHELPLAITKTVAYLLQPKVTGISG